MKLLKSKEGQLHKLASELVEKETLDYSEILNIVKDS
jgi:ATP-dependent Zn protease